MEGLIFAAAFAVLAPLQRAPAQTAPQQKAPLIAGTFDDRLVSEGPRAQLELRPSVDRDLPGLADGDRVFRGRTPQWPRPGTGGMAVALVETTTGSFVFVDANLDGRLTESERQPALGEIAYDIALPRSGVMLPYRCRVVTDDQFGTERRILMYTASFRAEGYASIGGRRTKVSLPFSIGSGNVTIRLGRIGVDANGDGAVDLSGFSGPEVMWSQGDRVVLRAAADRYVSVESADFASRSFVLREHPASDYLYVEVRLGEPMPDFHFTDFNGAARTLSEFRGRIVLLDFWGTWCGPCVAELPALAAARERFHARGFEVLGIDYEHGTTVDQARAFLADRRIAWPNATPDSIRDLVEKRLRILSFPTKILLDRDGRVIEMDSSALTGARLIARLEDLLR